MSLPIKSKYLLITGATSDIGTAIARKLSGTHNLLLHGRDRVKLEELAEDILSGNEIKIWVQDLSDCDSIASNLSALLSQLDIEVSDFVHCAGMVRILPLKNFRSDYYKEIFSVNFYSAVEIVKILIRKPNVQALRNILFISAYFSKFGDKGNSIYAATKGAIDSFVKSLAVELAPSVRVNSVLPGAIRTKMTGHLFEEEQYMQNFYKRYLLGEGSCSDIAEMVSFLLSSSAKWITGQNMMVDGGASIH
jgi:short-subunit dehydrogenase